MTWSTRFLAVSWGAFVVGLLGWVGAGVFIGMMMPVDGAAVGSIGLGWGIFAGSVGLGFAAACKYRGGNAAFSALVNAGLIGVGCFLLVGAALFL